MSRDDRKDMKTCSGGIPTISQRIFEICAGEVDEGSPYMLPLCTQHLKDITKDITRPQRDRIAELEAELKKTREEVSAELLAEWSERRQLAEAKAQEARYKRSRVYFMRSGKYIKIGTSTDLYSRLAAIQKSGGVLMPDGLDYPRTELVLAVRGDHRREKDLHRKFAHLRHTGEWFIEKPELTEYIQALAEKEAA